MRLLRNIKSYYWFILSRILVKQLVKASHMGPSDFLGLAGLEIAGRERVFFFFFLLKKDRKPAKVAINYLPQEKYLEFNMGASKTQFEH